jgi:hypothetical protein
MIVQERKITVKKAKADIWSGLKNYEACAVKMHASIDSKLGSIKSGLSKEDETRLETELNLKVGELSKNSPFWVDYFVMIPSEGLDLDLSLPEHELMYKVLSVKKIIAKSISELKTNALAEYVISDEEQEVEIEIAKRKDTSKAWAKFEEMNTEDRKAVLIAYGQAPYSMSNNKIEKVLGDILELDPKKFISTIEDPLYKGKVFVNTCVHAGVLSKRGSAIYFDRELIGASLEGAISYFKEKENQNVTLAVKQALQNKQKE